MKPLIYILEDDAHVAKVIARALQDENFSAEVFKSKQSFLAQSMRKLPDLCLIDLGLPDGDGLSVVTGFAKSSGVPAIVVTGKGGLTDTILGLEVGADDYVVKPFEPRELVARVRAVLRRHKSTADQNAQPTVQHATFAGWSADFSSCTLTDPDNNTIDLSAAETRLLLLLLKSAGRVLSRSDLMDHIRQSDDAPFDRSVDARISRLRKRLNDDPKSPQLLKTVYGAGYIFSAKVEWQ